MTDPETLQTQAKKLHLHGLLANWTQAADAGWAETLITWEQEQRAKRSLERRLKLARIGKFKPLCDFDWTWPERCDRAAIEDILSLGFLKTAGNIILAGPNGVGKTTIARNIAYQALVNGHTVRFTTAGHLLGDLAAQETDLALRRRLRHYTTPALLVIDEVGYLSYSNRHADLLFELISRRYQIKSTIITTNRNFEDWPQVFPNAACVVAMVDRLIHNGDIITITGQSYRLKESRENAKQRIKKRRANQS